jgi:hypothetical protein
MSTPQRENCFGEKTPGNDRPYIRSKRRGAMRHAIFAAKVYHGMTVLSRKNYVS